VANTLWYGDNLDVLRQHIGTASVDLVYLDPPFKSDAQYNVLFRSHSGTLRVHRSRHLMTLGPGDPRRSKPMTKLSGGGHLHT
jgi:16S rRNA G966 N2-methylase RsmD